jgi:TBC1 domain family protein 5
MLADMDSRSAYDHLFNSGLSLSKIKDAALGGTLFHPDVTCDLASTGVPGRSLAWKVQSLRPFSPRTQRQLTPRSIDLSFSG